MSKLSHIHPFSFSSLLYCTRYLIVCLLTIAPLHAAPDHQFALLDTSSKTHSLSQYQGKWVMVNYWAPWCPPCLEEVPDLVAFYEQHRERNVMVLGVAVDYATEKEVRSFVDDMLMSYPIILAKHPANKAQVLSAKVLPSTYIYNPDGELVKIKRGLVTKQYLEKLMSAKTNNKPTKKSN